MGESEEEADTVLHTAAQPGLAEAEEHAVTHTPVSQQLAQNTVYGWVYTRCIQGVYMAEMTFQGVKEHLFSSSF